MSKNKNNKPEDDDFIDADKPYSLPTTAESNGEYYFANPEELQKDYDAYNAKSDKKGWPISLNEYVDSFVKNADKFPEQIKRWGFTRVNKSSAAPVSVDETPATPKDESHNNTTEAGDKASENANNAQQGNGVANPLQNVRNLAIMQSFQQGRYKPIEMPTIVNPTGAIQQPQTGVEKVFEPVAQQMTEQNNQNINDAANGVAPTQTPETANEQNVDYMRDLSELQRLNEEGNKLQSEIGSLEAQEQRATKMNKARHLIGSIADGIASIANVWGAVKGATPMQQTSATGMVNEQIARDTKLRGENIQRLYKNLQEIERLKRDYRRLGIQQQRADTYATRTEQRERELELKAKQYAEQNNLKAEQLRVRHEEVLERLRQSGIRLELMDAAQQYRAYNDEANRLFKEKIEEQKRADKETKEATKKLDAKIKALGGDINSFNAAKKSAIESGANADEVNKLQASEAGVRRLIELAPKWAKDNGYTTDSSANTTTPSGKKANPMGSPEPEAPKKKKNPMA